jgi:hypothetical protein
VLAIEVYQWVDEDGVVHFSQSVPPGNVSGVETRTLEDTTPHDYDPDDDLYGVKAQAERMAQLREAMDARREAGRERQQEAARQPVVQYPQPVQYGYPWLGRPPYFGKPRPPPLRPGPPIPEPYPTDVLGVPGRLPD